MPFSKHCHTCGKREAKRTRQGLGLSQASFLFSFLSFSDLNQQCFYRTGKKPCLHVSLKVIDQADYRRHIVQLTAIQRQKLVMNLVAHRESLPCINSPVVIPLHPMFSSEMVSIDRPSVPSLVELRNYSVLIDLMDYRSQHVPCGSQLVAAHE